MNAHAQLVSTILKYTFGLVPIIAGLDKFTNLLADWTTYPAAWMINLIPLDAATFMAMVGIIEIGAGILVLIRPWLGGMVVSAWLLLIAVSLILGGHYLDVAVRDVVMAIAAFSLAKLSSKPASSGLAS